MRKAVASGSGYRASPASTASCNARVTAGDAGFTLTVTGITAVIGGLGTWLIGPERTVHIGASGLVFGYLSYLVSRGIFARKLSYLLGGVVVLAVYGGALWGLLPTPGISWQGHLFGAVGGIAAASTLHGSSPDRRLATDG